jgi:hypothetical protein
MAPGARDLIMHPAIDADYVGFPVRHETPYGKNGRVLPGRFRGISR